MHKFLEAIPKEWTALSQDFFARPATEVAPDLLNCILLKKTESGWMGGLICETEAYTEDDAASHTFRGKTIHNASMYEEPSTLYVYRSYGIHYCLNFSTGRVGRGEGVLIRALFAMFGTLGMVAGASKDPLKICSGPGRLCAALQIDKDFNGHLLEQSLLSVWKPEFTGDFERVLGPRVGISKGLDLNWRFGIKAHPSLSKPFRAIAPSTRNTKKIIAKFPIS